MGASTAGIEKEKNPLFRALDPVAQSTTMPHAGTDRIAVRVGKGLSRAFSSSWAVVGVAPKRCSRQYCPFKPVPIRDKYREKKPAGAGFAGDG
jgi:hypothetical protein